MEKAFFKNIAAAWRGDGPWFPNLKAAQNTNMSWSQFFFGTWGTPLTEDEPKEIASSPKLIKQVVEEPRLVEERDGDLDPMNKSAQLLVDQLKVDHVGTLAIDSSESGKPMVHGKQHDEGSVVMLRDKSGLTKNDSSDPQLLSEHDGITQQKECKTTNVESFEPTMKRFEY